MGVAHTVVWGPGSPPCSVALVTKQIASRRTCRFLSSTPGPGRKQAVADPRDALNRRFSGRWEQVEWEGPHPRSQSVPGSSPHVSEPRCPHLGTWGDGLYGVPAEAPPALWGLGPPSSHAGQLRKPSRAVKGEGEGPLWEHLAPRPWRSPRAQILGGDAELPEVVAARVHRTTGPRWCKGRRGLGGQIPPLPLLCLESYLTLLASVFLSVEWASEDLSQGCEED